MNTELDNLKSTWQTLSHSRGGKPADDAEAFTRAGAGRRCIAGPRKIVSIYRRLTVVCAVWVPLSLMFIRADLFPSWMPFVMAGYFAVMGALAYAVLDEARNIDFCRMSVMEAMKAVCRIQRLRLWHKCVGAMLCVPILAVMFMSFARVNNEVLMGGVLGLVVGAAIGLTLDMKVRREIREMKNTLAELSDR